VIVRELIFVSNTASAIPEMVGALQDLNGSRDLTTLLSGAVCHLWARTCYDQPNLKSLSLCTMKI